MTDPQRDKLNRLSDSVVTARNQFEAISISNSFGLDEEAQKRQSRRYDESHTWLMIAEAQLRRYKEELVAPYTKPTSEEWHDWNPSN